MKILNVIHYLYFEYKYIFFQLIICAFFSIILGISSFIKHNKKQFFEGDQSLSYFSKNGYEQVSPGEMYTISFIISYGIITLTIFFNNYNSIK